MNQKSIFAASQRAAKMVEQDRPILDFAKTDNDRIRDYLLTLGFNEKEIMDSISGYSLISQVRKKLGIKD